MWYANDFVKFKFIGKKKSGVSLGLVAFLATELFVSFALVYLHTEFEIFILHY